MTLTNVYDPGYNRGPADYDVTHTLSSSWIYELPFARESRLGGWQVNGIVYWRTGLPFTVTQTGQMLSTGVVNNRPDRIGDGRAAEPDGRAVVRHRRVPAGRPTTPAPSAARAGTSCAVPASSTWTCR